MKKVLVIVLLLVSCIAHAQQLNIALLKYRGGGDWYGNPTSLPNLVRFCNKEMGTDINPEVPTVEPSSPDIFNYPYVYMTGHGNVVFDAAEAQNLRNSMLAGGFTPDVVEDVILKNSVALKDNPELARTMIDDCVQIRRFYHISYFLL